MRACVCVLAVTSLADDAMARDVTLQHVPFCTCHVPCHVPTLQRELIRACCRAPCPFACRLSRGQCKAMPAYACVHARHGTSLHVPPHVTRDRRHHGRCIIQRDDQRLLLSSPAARPAKKQQPNLAAAATANCQSVLQQQHNWRSAEQIEICRFCRTARLAQPAMLSPSIRAASGPRLLRPAPCGLPQLRRTIVIVHAAKKGFGGAKQAAKDDAKSRKGGKRSSSGGVGRQQKPPLLPSGLDVALQQYDQLEEAKKRVEEEAEFAARLELIKAEAAQKKAAGLVPAPAAAPSSSSSSSSVDGGGGRAVFDPPPPEQDIYANPPSVLSTLQEQLQSDISDPALRQAKIGPGQVGLAVGALLFGLAFVLVSGGDFATTSRYKGLRPSSPPPEPIEMSRLASQAERFEAAADANPGDVESLEAAAVTYARMQDFGRASELLTKLTAARPRDAEAWRLLGESSLLNADTSKSVAAYEKAIALSPDDQQIVTGMVDAYVANSQQAKAISYLTDLRERLMTAATAAGSSASDEATASDAASVAAALPGEQDAGAAASSSAGEEASSSGRPRVDAIQVQLLLGKSYAAWRGHDADALAAYNTLIGAFPSDFRGYLAKGLFLRERGRQGDAQRMLLQARFYAPPELQAFVAARAGEAPDVGPLPDNGLE